jgi:hypothetical protein
MLQNWTNYSGVTTSGSCQWCWKFQFEQNGVIYSFRDFGPNWSKIWGNFEYLSRRKFYKLSKQSGNSKFQYRTKGSWRVEVGKILKIWLQIGIDFFCIFWFSRLASWCNMNVWGHATCRSYLFLTKKKLLSHIGGVRIVSGNSHSSLWLALMIQLMKCD